MMYKRVTIDDALKMCPPGYEIGKKALITLRKTYGGSRLVEVPNDDEWGKKPSLVDDGFLPPELEVFDEVPYLRLSS